MKEGTRGISKPVKVAHKDYTFKSGPQQGYYIPHQRNDEVLLLKCYDSDERAARFTAHSAFADPTSPPDAPSRESIEARTIVFFAP